MGKDIEGNYCDTAHKKVVRFIRVFMCLVGGGGGGGCVGGFCFFPPHGLFGVAPVVARGR